MTAIMNCPFIPIAARPQSHRGAQGVIYADMLKQTGVDIEINWGGKIEDHNAFDEMYVYHGSDWTGGLNFFGGVFGSLRLKIFFRMFFNQNLFEK